jgi:hypothetical protein
MKFQSGNHLASYGAHLMSTNTKKLALAALAGLLTTGFMAAPAMASANPFPQGYKMAAAEKEAAPEQAMEKHACKGMNSCKGNGGCKTEKNACKGQNSCKGMGGCATDGSKK